MSLKQRHSDHREGARAPLQVVKVGKVHTGGSVKVWGLFREYQKNPAKQMLANY